MTSLSWIRKGSILKYDKEENWPQSTSLKPSKETEIYEIVSIRPKFIRIKYEDSQCINFLEISPKTRFKRLSKKKMCGLWIETEDVEEGDNIKIQNDYFLVIDTEHVKTSIGLENCLKLTSSSYDPYLDEDTCWYEKATGILLQQNFERQYQRQPRRGWASF